MSPTRTTPSAPPRRQRLGFVLLFTASLLMWTSPCKAESEAEQAAALATEAIEKGRTGRYLEAIDLFQRAYELDPAPMLLYNIGRVRLRIGDLQRALSSLERYLATEDDPAGLARGRAARDEALAKWQGKLQCTHTRRRRVQSQRSYQ